MSLVCDIRYEAASFLSDFPHRMITNELTHSCVNHSANDGVFVGSLVLALFCPRGWLES